MTVLSAPEMRFGTKQDVPFIIAVIRDGMRDGYFNFDDDDGLSQFESQISEAIARRERGENCADFLFVFDAQHNGAAIGFALLTGKMVQMDLLHIWNQDVWCYQESKTKRIWALHVAKYSGCYSRP